MELIIDTEAFQMVHNDDGTYERNDISNLFASPIKKRCQLIQDFGADQIQQEIKVNLKKIRTSFDVYSMYFYMFI